MASPSMTYNTIAGVRASATQTHATNTSVDYSTKAQLDLSAKFAGRMTVVGTFGTVAATAGLQIQCFQQYSATSATFETIASISYVIPAVASTTSSKTLELPTGKWKVTLTNLDATNDVTAVTISMDTIDSIA